MVSDAFFTAELKGLGVDYLTKLLEPSKLTHGTESHKRRKNEQEFSSVFATE